MAERAVATRIYVDGVLDAEEMASDATDVNTTSPLHIGKSHQDGNAARRFFKGMIDEVSIYNRALSEDEMEMNLLAKGLTVESSVWKLAIAWGEVKVKGLLP